MTLCSRSQRFENADKNSGGGCNAFARSGRACYPPHRADAASLRFFDLAIHEKRDLVTEFPGELLDLVNASIDLKEPLPHDLPQFLDALLEAIVPHISKLMRAERTTLFLYDAASEQIETLIKLTKRYCVIYQTLQKVPNLTTTWTRTNA